MAAKLQPDAGFGFGSDESRFNFWPVHLEVIFRETRFLHAMMCELQSPHVHVSEPNVSEHV